MATQPIEIKDIFDKVLFASKTAKTIGEAATEAVRAGVRLRGSDLSYYDLRGSDLRGSDLRDSDLRDSDLRDSDLSDCNFRESTLKGAKTSLEESIALRPIQLSDKYWITIFDTSMWIGCLYHRLSDWWAFTDREIIEMDGREGFKWWRTWKPILQQIVESREEA